MTLFALFAALLVIATAAFVLRPLWLGRLSPQASADRKAANLAIFRDQLAELERERAEGTLGDADFDQSQRELQRRLLEEVDGTPAGTTKAQAGPSRGLAIALMIFIPLAAMAGYTVLGTPQALDPARAAARPQMTEEQINGLVARLAERMQSNPDDMQGWLMLGRSYKAMGRYADAAAAYEKAEKVVNEDPDLLATYAEVVALAEGKGLAGKPARLIQRALKLDPKHAHSLFLAGAAAMEAGDAKRGIAYWETLLPQVEPGSELEQMLRKGIEKMKAGG